MSSIVNKVKNALHSDDTTGTTGTAEGVHGPHSSRVANAADPRIDSDLDHRGAGASTIGGADTTYATGNTNYTYNSAGGAGTGTGAGFGATGGPAPNTAGPHRNDLLNKADPRVDSDRDGSRNMGAAHRGTAGTTGYAGTGTGAAGTTGTTGGWTGSSTTTGTQGGYSNTGVTGFDDPEGTHGPHGSRLANAADPRIDSDRDHRGTAYTSAPGTGPAANTAGPHRSDMANKLDPRVDSDLDGSKTIGGNKTYRSGETGTVAGTGGRRDPLDAAQVPPSVMRAHVGEPSIEHGDFEHDRHRRNSTATHQETFRGI